MIVGFRRNRLSAARSAGRSPRSWWQIAKSRRTNLLIRDSGILTTNSAASGAALLGFPASGKDGGNFARCGSVHAAGSPFRSSTVAMPLATARSAHFRHAVQYEFRCAAQQNLPALPPGRRRSAWPHQGHIGAASGPGAALGWAGRFVLAMDLASSGQVEVHAPILRHRPVKERDF